MEQDKLDRECVISLSDEKYEVFITRWNNYCHVRRMLYNKLKEK